MDAQDQGPPPERLHHGRKDRRALRRGGALAAADAKPKLQAEFACSVCGARAGLVLIDGDEARRESWPGVAIYPDSAPAALREAIEHADVRRLFELNFELTPFYCPRCEASYCSDHWDWWDVWDDDLPSWRDSVRGRCPHGHERMLED